MKKFFAAMMTVFAVGCGVQQGEVVEPDFDTGTDSEELSTASRTYVTARRDYRKCSYPMCSGWFIADVNRVSPKEQYVYKLDFSKSGLSEEAINKVTGAEPVVLHGKLGPLFQGFRSFIVSSAWLGMPGVQPVAGEKFFKVKQVDIQCFKAPCPSLEATKLNSTAGTLYHVTKTQRAALQLVDTNWQRNRVELHGALVAGKFVNGQLVSGSYENVLDASQVYVKLPEDKGPCPVFKLAQCPDGKVHTFTRSADRCILPAGCVTGGACAAFVPSCAQGYVHQSWTGGQFACTQYACDPAFSLPEEIQ